MAEEKSPEKAAEGNSVSKISRMSLEQVDKAISLTKEKMGGLYSAYGKSLVERKAVLKNSK